MIRKCYTAHTQVLYCTLPGTSDTRPFVLPIQQYDNLPSPPLPLGPSRLPQCSGVPLSAVAASWPPLHPSLPPADGGGREVPAQRHRTYTGHVRVSGWASPQYQYSSGFAYDATMSLYNIIIESIISTSHAVNKMFFEESSGYNQPIKNVIS